VGFMSFLDIFKTKQLKETIENQEKKIQDLESLLTPELKNILNAKNMLNDLNKKIAEVQVAFQNKKIEYDNAVAYTNTKKAEFNAELSNIANQINYKRNQLIEMDDAILMQSFGLYTPIYNLMNSEAYKNRLIIVRNRQKQMIRDKTAMIIPNNMTYNNDVKKGMKIVNDTAKLVLRAFNNECETLIDKVKYNNVEAIKNRIIKSYEDLNKLNATLNIRIRPEYLSLKNEELYIAYEYSVKKQEEKDEARRLREEMREEAKLQKEIQEARKNIDKEQKHYLKALKNLILQMSQVSDIEKEYLLSKKEEIENKLSEIEQSIKEIDYREANQKAGYVYIISNIGSFGENIYKIGMTRRLEPTERVDELGDASVPFNFDIHAMIFSNDAPKLEAALHRAFDDKKVNMINKRREFFNVTLDEIKKVVRENFDRTVEFIDIPSAEQYRESLKIKGIK
jgi:hypothetical protein